MQKKLTRKELVNEIHNRLQKEAIFLSKKDVKAVVDEFINVVHDSIRVADEVTLSGIGKFVKRDFHYRAGFSDPAEGTTKALFFSASEALKKAAREA